MTKSELIKMLLKICKDKNMAQITQIIDIVFEEISEALSKGDRVELRGFGCFISKTRDSRVARDPRNNRNISLGKRSVIQFRMGKEFFDLVNSKQH